MLDKLRGAPLHAVRSRLAERLAARYVAANRVSMQRSKAHCGCGQRGGQQLAVSIDYRHGRQHFVSVARQAREHRFGIVGVERLAENRVVDRDGCIRNQNRSRGVVAGYEPGMRGPGFGHAHALHVVVRTLAG